MESPCRTSDLAVVIPTLNEAEALRSSLPPLVDIATEIVVSDGGSDDDTVAIARALGARVISGPTGRGVQLNAGARAADASTILFLHADTLIDSHEALEGISTALAEGYVGGGFEIYFDAPGAVYRFGSTMVNLRTRLTRMPLGDQGQFVSRQAFEAVGGFQEWPILEDLDFIRRLKAHGRLEVLRPPLATSARRFERYGPVRTLANNWLIFALFFLGMPPARLARLYPNTGA